MKYEPGISKLFPVFLKLEQLRVLLVGAGNVALEKLNAILSSSPETEITVVAANILPEFAQLASPYRNVTVIHDLYHKDYIEQCDILFTAVNSIELSQQICTDAHEKGILINCADNPALCEFYLGSVVTKGNLRLAISTNGKSPTLAKRLKELLNDVLPDELDELLHNLQTIRNNLKGNFKEKVHSLNELTKTLVK